jgi:hypothetical protein
MLRLVALVRATRATRRNIPEDAIRLSRDYFTLEVTAGHLLESGRDGHFSKLFISLRQKYNNLICRLMLCFQVSRISVQEYPEGPVSGESSKTILYSA